MFRSARLPLLLFALLAAGCAPLHSVRGTRTQGNTLPVGQPVLVLQVGHQDDVESVAFTPDGKTLVSGSRDRTVDLWDARTGELVRTLSGPDGPVLSVAADNAVAAGAGEDRTVRIWDLHTGALRRTLRGPAGSIKAVALSPDGLTVAGGSETVYPGQADGEVTLWDRRSGARRRTLATRMPVAALAYSPNGRHLAVAGDFMQQMPGQQWPVQIWDTKTGRLLRSLPAHNVAALQFLSDGGTLVTGGGQEVEFWNTDTGQQIRTLTLSLPVPAEWSSPAVHYLRVVTLQALAVSPDGGKIAVGVGGTGENAAAIFDAVTGARLQTLRGFRAKVAAIAFSPDGATLATGTGDAQPDSKGGDVALWDVQSGRLRRAMNGDNNWVWSVAIAGNGRTFVTGNPDHTARVWDAGTGALLQTLTDPAKVFVAAVSPNGSIATGNENAAVRLWDVKTGRVNVVIAAHAEHVDSLAWSPDGRTLASGGGSLLSGEVKTWDGHTGRLRRRMAGTSEGINAVAFSPNGREIAAGGYDNTVKIWDAGTGKLERTLDGYDGYVETVAFSPDGKQIAAGKDSRPGGEFKIWDARTGHLEHAWIRLPYSVDEAAFSPDGKQIALACRLDDQRLSTDDTCVVQVWDLPTGKRRWTLPGPRYGVHSLAFAPDGRSLLTASRDDAVRLWDTRTGALRLTLRVLPPSGPGSQSADWIAFTPGGYYADSPGAETRLRWRIGGRLFPASAYAGQFRRSDFVQRALREGS